MASVITVQVNDILSVIHTCILLTIIVGFCRIVDRVLLKIVGQLASSVEYTYYGFSRCHLYSMRLESHMGFEPKSPLLASGILSDCTNDTH